MKKLPGDDVLAENAALKIIIASVIDMILANRDDRSERIKDMCEFTLDAADRFTWRNTSGERAEMLTEMIRERVTAFFVGFDKPKRQA